MDILRTLRETFLDLESMGQALPELITVGLPKHLDPRAVLRGGRHCGGDGPGCLRAVPLTVAALAGADLHRHLPRSAGVESGPPAKVFEAANSRRLREFLSQVL